MSIGQIIVLAVIVGAFVVFAAALGWGDYRTQQLTRRIRDRDRKEGAMAASAMALMKVSNSVAAASGTSQARWPQPPSDRLRHVA
jgi:Kef-type K+ transport system membrane component KefB